MNDEKFNLYWTDMGGTQHKELEYVPFNDDFKSALIRLTKGPAAQLGVVEEVLVTDTGDMTCFLWQKGKVIFPTK